MLEQARSTWERWFAAARRADGSWRCNSSGFDRDMALPDMPCEHCGLEMVQPAVVRGRTRVFCSERCRRDASVGSTGDRSLAA